jgi:phage replication initiation protein
MGFLAFGGESQAGRWLLSLTGKGCAFVTRWDEVADLLEGLGAKITRLDLAVDFLEGEHTVDEAVAWHEAGGFAFNGRMAPKSHVAGDWIDRRDGRTFYVGKAQNGKMLRVYEKGRQLGDPESPWVRFEVQLGNRDREIPLRALVDRDAFFAGAYPALGQLVERAAEYITTSRAKGQTTLAHLVHHLRRSYGKLVDVLSRHVDTSSTDLVDEVRVIGLPRRLDFTSAVAGVEWAGVVATLERIKRCNA